VNYEETKEGHSISTFAAVGLNEPTPSERKKGKRALARTGTDLRPFSFSKEPLRLRFKIYEILSKTDLARRGVGVRGGGQQRGPLITERAPRRNMGGRKKSPNQNARGSILAQGG